MDARYSKVPCLPNDTHDSEPLADASLSLTTRRQARDDEVHSERQRYVSLLAGNSPSSEFKGLYVDVPGC